MFKFKTLIGVAIDGDPDNAERENIVQLKLTGYLPFAPLVDGFRIEAVVPNTRPPVIGTISVKRPVWFPGPGGTGYWEADCEPEYDGCIMTADAFEEAFQYIGWEVIRS